MGKTIIAALIALITCLVVGKPLISYLKRLKYGQVIRDDGPTSHLKKSGTPSMGGLMILLGIVLASIFTGAIRDSRVLVALLMMLFMGAVGFVDDYIKIVKKRSLGLKAREKLILQIIAAVALTIFVYLDKGLGSTLTLPFFTNVSFNMGIFYIPFAIVFVVGFVNAVNLTDGLDGLAAGSSGIAALAYVVICLIFKNYNMAAFAAAILGACAGFTYFNANPAKVFMGDTGSLALGGALVSIALFTKTELHFFLIGGVFLIEAISVIIQVGSYKITGRRVFKMSPLHHHYELSGIAETKMVYRFWILAAILGLLGILAI